MYLGATRQIQKEVSASSVNTNDIMIFLTMLECSIYNQLERVDKIETLRKVWYQTLATISDTSVSGMSATALRAFVRNEFTSQLSDIRAVNNLNKNTSANNDMARPRSFSSGSGTHEIRKGGFPCRQFNSDQGCQYEERHCRFRHICQTHFERNMGCYSNHSAQNCSLNKSQDGQQQNGGSGFRSFPRRSNNQGSNNNNSSQGGQY